MKTSLVGGVSAAAGSAAPSAVCGMLMLPTTLSGEGTVGHLRPHLVTVLQKCTDSTTTRHHTCSGQSLRAG